MFIWQGDSTSSQIECDVIQHLFETSGFEVHRLNWHSSSKTEFLKAYYRQEFDLIWISGHGEFNQFKPHLSSIVLYQDMSGTESTNITVDYHELQPFNAGGLGRRLLVLNICDGATTTLDNSPAAIGLGAQMLSEYQSLISHLWPIDPCAGMITGFLLAKALAEGKSYIETYLYAVESFLAGKKAVIAIARETLPEIDLANAIELNSSVDFDNLFFYGSVMYAE